MKPSFYNFFYPFKEHNNKILAYNALNSSLALMDEDKYELLCDFLENKKHINDKSFVEDLIRGGYLIDDDTDEIAILQLQLLQNRFDSNQMGLTIAVTADCNFRCTYCYEKNNIQNSYMSQEVQDNIIKLVCDEAGNINDLTITWYGGEPLLALNVIKQLSKEIIKICEDNNVNYSAYIVTNGYLLTREIAVELIRLKVEGMQITIDGPEDIHNSRRPLVGGKPTFDKILANIKESISVFPNITIRLNTDIDNVNRVNEIFTVLHEYNLAGKVEVYLGFVENVNDSYIQYKCMTPESFSRAHFNFIMDNNLDAQVLYPQRLTNFCCADSLNSFVVGVDGLLYKCWNDIGIEEYSIGKLSDEGISEHNMKRNAEYLLYDACQDKICIECKYLPICMGGCPNKRLQNMNHCCDTKYILQDYLKACATSIIEERKRKLNAEGNIEI